MSGNLKETVTADQSLVIYVAKDDCMAPDARVLSRVLAADSGRFFAEVFVPCGWNLSLCATVEAKNLTDGTSKPTRRYGKNDKSLLAQGEGEIEFKDLSWSLADGPERTMPALEPAGSRP